MSAGARPLTATGSQSAKAQPSPGAVTSTHVRPFWRDKSVSPGGAGHHYNLNAETYMEVGLALGRAMAELLQDD